MAYKKQYGLLIPKKNTTAPVQKRANIFGDDSDEDKGNSPLDPWQRTNTQSTRVKKQTQIAIDMALSQDPNVYEYDTIYENMQEAKMKTDVKVKDKAEKKSKYVVGLLKHAETRKREDERRLERKVQNEREAEGDEFADKEAFVTSAYKKKMLDQQAEEEKEKREATMEAMLDVRKQKDMSGFYRYLYRETAGADGTEQTNEGDSKTEGRATDVKVKMEHVSGSETSNSSQSDSQSDSESDSDSQDSSKQHKRKSHSHIRCSPPGRNNHPSRERKPRKSRSSSRERSHKYVDRSQSHREYSERHKQGRSRSTERQRREREEDAYRKQRSEGRRKRSRSKDRSRSRYSKRSRSNERSTSRDRRTMLNSKERSRSRDRSKVRSRSKDRKRQHRSGSRDVAKAKSGHNDTSPTTEKRNRSPASKEVSTKTVSESTKTVSESTKTVSESTKTVSESTKAADGQEADCRNIDADSDNAEDVTLFTGPLPPCDDPVKTPAEAPPKDWKAMYVKHTTEDKAADARRRYMERKLAKQQGRDG